MQVVLMNTPDKSDPDNKKIGISIKDGAQRYTYVMDRPGHSENADLEDIIAVAIQDLLYNDGKVGRQP